MKIPFVYVTISILVNFSPYSVWGNDYTIIPNYIILLLYYRQVLYLCLYLFISADVFYRNQTENCQFNINIPCFLNKKYLVYTDYTVVCNTCMYLIKELDVSK